MSLIKSILTKTLRLFSAEFFDFGLVILGFGFMPYTYFILSSDAEISQLKNIDDVFNQIEKRKPMLGGFFSLQSITSLCRIFENNEKGNPIPTKYVWSDGSQFYELENDLCKKVAGAKYNELLDASVIWSESEPWRDTKINRMDLAGMILEFTELCKQTKSEKHLYFLLSNEK